MATVIELGATARPPGPHSLIEMGLVRTFGDEPRVNQQIGAVRSIVEHPLGLRDSVLSPQWCPFGRPV